jgi:hypothetical protein
MPRQPRGLEGNRRVCHYVHCQVESGAALLIPSARPICQGMSAWGPLTRQSRWKRLVGMVIGSGARNL